MHKYRFSHWMALQHPISHMHTWCKATASYYHVNQAQENENGSSIRTHDSRVPQHLAAYNAAVHRQLQFWWYSFSRSRFHLIVLLGQSPPSRKLQQYLLSRCWHQSHMDQVVCVSLGGASILPIQHMQHHPLHYCQQSISTAAQS